MSDSASQTMPPIDVTHDVDSPFHRQRIALPSGIVLNLISWSSPVEASAHRPLWLLHGLGDAACVWRDVAATLAQTRPVFALDLHGHGDSDWLPEGDYRNAAMAADVASIINRFALLPPILVGHSMGGNIALQLASDHPGAIDRLVLADYGPDADPANTAHLRQGLRDAHRPYDTIAAYAALLCARHPLADPILLNWVASRTLRRNSSGGFALKYDTRVLSARERATMAPGHELSWRQLANLDCATLLLRGAASALLSARTAQEMAHRVLKKGQLRSIPMAGHAIALDNPAAVAAAIAEFADY
jgi:pimeloyl-ACP methyl ester carboxylesterase